MENTTEKNYKVNNFSYFKDYQKENSIMLEPYYIGFIMRHVDKYASSSGRFKIQFVKFIRSIFKNLKRLDHNIHFIILTDLKSSPHVVHILDKFLQKDVFDKVRVAKLIVIETIEMNILKFLNVLLYKNIVNYR